jgi:hypothetical protein
MTAASQVRATVGSRQPRSADIHLRSGFRVGLDISRHGDELVLGLGEFDGI